MTHSYSRRIHFFETDAMGIVHHAIYLHLFEEARVDCLRQLGVLKISSLDKINYPVLESQVKYNKPLYFDDEVNILLTVKHDKVRIYFDYEITTKRFPEIVAFGKTIHIAMDMSSRKPIRVPVFLAKCLP